MGKIVECKIKDWDDFELKLKDLEAERIALKGSLSISDFLFRGQSDSGWKLKTTLDRYVGGYMSLEEYYTKTLCAKPQIETSTGQTWNIMSKADYMGWLKKSNGWNAFDTKNLKEIEYMVYLRHHGFPSPLLDWTRSPYIAAFFAFDEVVETEGTDCIAIYSYLESNRKERFGGNPFISSIGRTIKTHQRHFLQQSEYTVCLKGPPFRKEPIVDDFYANHEDVINNGQKEQDLIWKLYIPKKERLVFLEKLDLMNINAYSLFGSEESLMNTVALRAFKLW